MALEIAFVNSWTSEQLDYDLCVWVNGSTSQYSLNCVSLTMLWFLFTRFSKHIFKFLLCRGKFVILIRLEGQYIVQCLCKWVNMLMILNMFVNKYKVFFSDPLRNHFANWKYLWTLLFSLSYFFFESFSRFIHTCCAIVFLLYDVFSATQQTFIVLMRLLDFTSTKTDFIHKVFLSYF